VFATTHALQAVELNATDMYMSPAVPSPKRENAWGLAPNARPRVASAARRTALGWAKRSTKASTDQKENTSMSGMSFMMTCVDTRPAFFSTTDPRLRIVLANR
jgi:hypothetical protein